jgi:hypothetical protein
MNQGKRVVPYRVMRGSNFMTTCLLVVILLFGPGKSFGQQGGIHPSGSPLTLFPHFGPQENATIASCSN